MDYIDHSDQDEGTNDEARSGHYFSPMERGGGSGWFDDRHNCQATAKSRSVAEDPESQLTNEFPFLPSYEMAMNEVRTSQQSIASSDTVVTTIDDGVILGIASPGTTAFQENQRNESETNHCVANSPRSRSSLDDGVVSEIEESVAIAPVEETVNL
ncbi:hypothetical protein pdam_00013037 [Pocillopora damicornis]|uniref:Uncharacterized protein n=1 Tax=Pocillopora damicornis TaxID=46731 RepID=A0A3M6V0H7_POCDA|nr:hypothetical protein pdam_00013037 [Pocillopora damicornis]